MTVQAAACRGSTGFAAAAEMVAAKRPSSRRRILAVVICVGFGLLDLRAKGELRGVEGFQDVSVGELSSLIGTRGMSCKSMSQ